MPKLLPRMSLLKKIARGDEKSSSKKTMKSHCVDPSPEVMKEITSPKKKK